MFGTMRAGGNLGCLNNNKSMPAAFYQASIQRITFHIPSEHTIYGARVATCIGLVLLRRKHGFWSRILTCMS